MKTSNNIPFLTAVLIGLAKAGPLTVSWGFAFDSGEEILSVSQEGAAVSSSCTNKLNLGDIEVAITADTEAKGNLIIGEQKYDLADDALCNAVWSEDFAQVSCEIPFDGKVNTGNLVTADHCFTSTNEEGMGDILNFMDGDGLALETVGESPEDTGDVTEWFDVSANPETAEKTGLVAKRQAVGVCSPISTEKRRDPANATKHTKHTQLSDTLECRAGSCGTAYGTTWSTSHGATISITGVPWISAGYSVTKSKGGSSTLSCNGDKGSTVCVKQRQAYQRYDVTQKTRYINTGGGECASSRSKNYSIRSPMNAGKYTKYYCGRGKSECTWKGRTGWRDNGKGAWVG